MKIPTPNSEALKTTGKSISAEEYQDKVLGALVGSAIGDAMGASTEMWARKDIQEKYGYIIGLTPVIREKSPEGTWKHNMAEGATTDDTRWKFLMGQYFKQEAESFSADRFTTYIVDYYKSLIDGLGESGAKQSTDLLDEEMDKVNWIKEWARVSMAYSKSRTEFAVAQNRFYGGEMSCAGMLYSPMFGLLNRDAESTYRLAFEHAVFDIGYARDISALVAVMTQQAMMNVSIDSIIEESLISDPYKFKDSRLIGRLAANMAMEARTFVSEKVDLPFTVEGEILDAAPPLYPGSDQEWFEQNVIYDRLSLKEKTIAFHAGEIWQILLAGLEFGQGDFIKTIQFIVNYGRDNDTVAAVAGMILGAHLGYNALPSEIKEEIVKVSREVMGLDLEELAESIVRSQDI